ncbi:AAA family ATPase, partial [Nocardiopsis umidischolae]
MEPPLFDFRAALSGEEPDPAETEEAALLEEQSTTTNRSESAPISVDLTSGLLLLRHAGSSVEVDTSTQEAVLDPGDSRVNIGDDGVMLFGAQQAGDTASPHVFPGQDTEHVVAVSAPAGDVSGETLHTESHFTPVMQGTPALPLEPTIASVGVPANAESVPEGETTAPESTVLAEPFQRAEATEALAPMEPQSFEAMTPQLPAEPLQEATALSDAPLETRSEVERGELYESERDPAGEPITGVEPISADADDPAFGENDSEIPGAPVVTLDPETAVTTVEAGELKFVLDPDTNTISIEPGDRNVPLDPEAAPLTVETGNLGLTIDPAEGTVEIETSRASEDGESLPTTIEVGDLKLTLDPETGEVTFDPGDGNVEVDPETGLITISEKDEDEEGEEGEDRPGGDGPGEEETPGGDRPGGDESGDGPDRPGGDRPGEDEEGGDRPGGDRPGQDEEGGDRPGGD